MTTFAHPSPRLALMAGAFLGLTGVLFGAFAAHALQDHLDARASGWFELAVTYQFRHALALLCCGVLQLIDPRPCWWQRAALLWVGGVTLFCGSLYIMAFTGVTRWGMVTPVGGVLLIGGWVSLMIGVWQLTRRPLTRP